MKVFPTFEKGGVKYTRDWLGRIVSAEKISDDINPQTQKEGSVNPVNEVKFWEIVNTDTKPAFPTGFKLYSARLDSPGVLRWNDYLIGYNLDYYPSGELQGGSFSGGGYEVKSQIKSVRVLYIKTGEIFDVSLDKPTWGELWSIANQTLDDAYYFGVGGAFGARLGYKLNLPPTRNSTIQKLEKTIGGKIEKIGNTYISSSCYEGCSYSLFNPKILTNTPLERMTAAANDYNAIRNEEFIGIDSQGRIILNVRNVPNDAQINVGSQQQFETEMLAASPLTDEAETTPLIQADALPEKMKVYLMIDGIDKILMLGSSKFYIYDLSQNVTKELKVGAKATQDLASIKQSYGYTSYTKTSKAICFTDTKNVKYAIDLTTEAYLDIPPSDCENLYAQKSAEEIFKGLELPQNYKLVPGQADYTDLTEWNSQ